MMWKNFKFSTTILLLVFSIACQPSVKFSSESSNENSAINSRECLMKSEFHRKEKIEENQLPKRAERKAESRESLQSYIGLIHPPLPDELKI